MPHVEVDVPDHIISEIDYLVDQGNFINRDQAVIELMANGISVYDAGPTETENPVDSMFTSAEDDQQDPAARFEP